MRVGKGREIVVGWFMVLAMLLLGVGLVLLTDRIVWRRSDGAEPMARAMGRAVDVIARRVAEAVLAAAPAAESPR